MRTDREPSGKWVVEFVGVTPEPAVPDDVAAAAIPDRERALMAVGVLVLLLVFAAVGHDRNSPSAAPRPTAPAPKPSISLPARPAPTAQVGTAPDESPTLAISKAFAAHTSGSVVISERTSLINRGRVLQSRVIRAFSGNVVLDVVVGRPTGPPPSHAIRIMQGDYAVTIRSKGYYPPTRSQLQGLAADRRLTAVV